MLEKKVKEKFKKFLEQLFPSCSYWNIVQGPYSQKGFPDIVVVLEGAVAFIEAKAPGNKPSELQTAALRSIAHAGGNAFILSMSDSNKLFSLKKIHFSTTTGWGEETVFLSVETPEDEAKTKIKSLLCV